MAERTLRLVVGTPSGTVPLALSDGFLRGLSRVVGYLDVEPQILPAATAVKYGLTLGVVGNLKTHPAPRLAEHPRLERWLDARLGLDR